MCLFCKIINRDIPAKIVYEDANVLAFLDISQTTKGHTLVVPKIHTSNFLECPSDFRQHVSDASVKIAKHLIESLRANGMNILTNINEAAGQSVMHYHVHLIPRYNENDGLTLAFKPNQNIDLDDLIEQIRFNEKPLD